MALWRGPYRFDGDSHESTLALQDCSPPPIFVVPQPYSSWYYRLVLIIGAFFPADAYARAGLLEYQACVSLDAQINVRVFGCSDIIADKSQPHATLIEALLNKAAA